MNREDYDDLENMLIQQHDEKTAALEKLVLHTNANHQLLTEINLKLQWLLYVGYVLIGGLIGFGLKYL
jgi:hypothetical protein